MRRSLTLSPAKTYLVFARDEIVKHVDNDSMMMCLLDRCVYKDKDGSAVVDVIDDVASIAALQILGVSEGKVFDVSAGRGGPGYIYHT